MQYRIPGPAGIALAIIALLVTFGPVAREARAAGADTVILNVEGMWNEACEEYIADSLLGDLEGVREVHADHDNNMVTVEFDPAGTSAEQIAATIENCPSFDVIGSETHELNEELIKKSRRSCCAFGCRNRDA